MAQRTTSLTYVRPVAADSIEARGIRVNNLRNVNVSIPHNSFTVVSGVSGSGKSSLVFDTLFAEGQRRYVESLSAYARQFLGRMRKPDCDDIGGLPPAIAIEQRRGGRNPRSTVGTVTEIYEYLRLLYARIGHTYSPVSGKEVKKHTPEQTLNELNALPEGTTLLLLLPLAPRADRTLEQQLQTKLQEGYSRLYIKEGTQQDGAGRIVRIDDYLEQSTTAEEPIERYLLVDRVKLSKEQTVQSRLTDSIETAFAEGQGQCIVVAYAEADANHQMLQFSTRFEADGITFEEPTPNFFSFNSPLGACPACEGFGNIIDIDEKLVIPHSELSVYEGCVQCWHGEKMSMWKDEFCRRAAADDFPIFVPYYELTQQQKDWLWHGLPSDRQRKAEDRVCIDNFFQMLKDNQYKIQYRVMLSRYKGKTTCPVCHGTRLRQETGYVRIGGHSLPEVVDMPIGEVHTWLQQLQLSPTEQQIAKRPLDEVRSRVALLADIGLHYLTLNRTANTLSGGESQRIHLVSSLGSSLVGSLYILDEPSIGLHSRDTNRLIHALQALRDEGNTIVVVEHDEDIIRQADYLIDMGPDAGAHGGEVVFAGTRRQMARPAKAARQRSYTLQYLLGDRSIPIPASRRPWNNVISVRGARMNNLKGIDVDLPLNVMTVVTGVSGSGKSSLVTGIVYPAMKRLLDEVSDIPGEHRSIEGDWRMVKHVELVNQTPIGKSTRSNPVTYMKAYDAIRQLFAAQPLAKQLGLTPQHFSFNTEGGRCETCKGMGQIAVPMQFMADVMIECDECHGQRFKHDVLDVRYRDHNINDILNLSVDEAIALFSSDKGNAAIISRLLPLQQVGLGYIKLGQDSTTLSGGESQRVKLAAFLGGEHQQHTLFILDEPTTGLHLHDIGRLLNVLEQLVRQGHSVLLIEHNLDVIKCADHIIDLGPEGGNEGGGIVVAGTPEQVAQCKESLTGQYLAKKLSMGR